MSATPTEVVPGVYHIQLGLDFSAQVIPPPKPLYLTGKGEGNQLTIENPTGEPNQEVND